MSQFSSNNLLSPKGLIQYYQLQPHPEGGWYKETYRSLEKITLPETSRTFPNDRNFSTAIYFLLEQGNFSQFHKIKSDECWHFYAGNTLYVYVLDQQTGQLNCTKLGRNILEGETFQFVVPANCWFASIPAEYSDWSFVGCTVAPGFDFTDFELAKKDALIEQFPEHEEIINQLCRQ